jgi:UDP-3-O-[3-hydroxymyristoyl] glucosamine N-acyltransferase
MVAPKAHHSGKRKSAASPSTVKLIQKIFRSIRTFYPQLSFPVANVYKGAMTLLVKTRSVKEVAEFVQARVLGDETVPLTGISSVQSAVPGDLIFVDDQKNLRLALESRASAVIAGDFAAAKTNSKPLLLAAQPRLAFARAAQLLCPAPERKPGIHPSAIVHPSARLANGVTVEERVVIGEGVHIGEGTWIGAGSVIGAKVSIGRNCDLYPNVTLYPSVRVGDRVIVHSGAVLGSDGFGYVRDQATGRYEKFPQVGRLEIEDDVEIGANTTIDRGALDVTRISRGAKIDNLVHIGHNCQIGQDVVIAAQTGLSGSITIEKDVVLGGQVGIGEHARIEEGVMLGGQGGVLPNKVLRGKGTAFWGTPAKPVREYLKELAALARLAKKE